MTREAAKEWLISVFIEMIEDDVDYVVDGQDESFVTELLERLNEAQYHNAAAKVEQYLGYKEED